MKKSPEEANKITGTCADYQNALDEALSKGLEDMGSYANIVFGEKAGDVFRKTCGQGEAVCSGCGARIRVNVALKDAQRITTFNHAFGLYKNEPEQLVGFVSRENHFNLAQITSVELSGDIAQRCQHTKQPHNL